MALQAGPHIAATSIGPPNPQNRARFSLAKKRSTDIVGGELCLGFELLGAAAAAQVAAEVEAELDPEALAAALSRRALHVRLHGINGLRANGLVVSWVEAMAGGLQHLAGRYRRR
jgi:hypothetical protein